MRWPSLRLLLLVSALALPLSACGKRGALEPPPRAEDEAKDKVAGEAEKPSKKMPFITPKRSLPIDFLLD